MEDSTMKKTVVGVVVGSARKGSFSKTVAETIVRLMPDSLDARLIAVGDLPVYNQDYDEEGASPAPYIHFREQVKECGAFLFVTPEHNRSMSALLKNALDIASRPYGANLWSGKPGAIVSVSPGTIGAFGANHAARQTISFLNVFLMPQPEAYISSVMDIIDQDGRITNEKSVAFFRQIAESFAAWVARFQ
jgi:chromate reductase